ncbi:hypothetical protein PCA31118_00103 [Pandoraea captiosa]|uniref:Uncharacterized protein n=1 Tax=Pandoraea captiosa TaxID=2508302 RepID=A0A5E4ZHA6_9BURK|nr:hypothetical protein PCA31118_00103 [Pandoraea captiosa]
MPRARAMVNETKRCCRYWRRWLAWQWMARWEGEAKVMHRRNASTQRIAATQGLRQACGGMRSRDANHMRNTLHANHCAQRWFPLATQGNTPNLRQATVHQHPRAKQSRHSPPYPFGYGNRTVCTPGQMRHGVDVWWVRRRHGVGDWSPAVARQSIDVLAPEMQNAHRSARLVFPADRPRVAQPPRHASSHHLIHGTLTACRPPSLARRQAPAAIATDRYHRPAPYRDDRPPCHRPAAPRN